MLRKQEALTRLAKKRQGSRVEGYFCLHEVAGGIYECDFVSPWSKSAHNVEARIMVVGQDWASRDRLEDSSDQAAIRDRIELGYDRRIWTNVNLQDLLQRHLRVAFADTYATNAFPFIKPGSMQRKIPPKHLIPAVQEFLLPQIAIIQPRLVICLGLSTFNAVQVSCGQRKLARLEDAISADCYVSASRIMVVAHTGARGTNTRGRDRVEADWVSIGKLLVEGD